jgi:lysophospholipase L1-like esterase
MKLEGLKINFLGDSITEGVGASEPKYNYVNDIARNAKLREAKNYGIGGTRIARQTEIKEGERFDIDFIMRVPEMDDDADIVVVFGGTNDYGHGQAPLGEFNDGTVFTFYGALHNLIKLLIKKYLGKPIVFLTPLHRLNETEKTSWKPDGVVQHPLIDYVKAIREVCEYYSIPVLDMYKESGISGNIPEYCSEFMPDGLHPNDKGHAIIADKIQKFLERL